MVFQQHLDGIDRSCLGRRKGIGAATCRCPRGAAPDCRYIFWNGITSERAIKGIAERTLAAVFKKSGVAKAHAHRFRHTLATELLGAGASFEEAADILGNSPEIVRKHYAKWSTARQARIDNLMDQVWAQNGHTQKRPVSYCRPKVKSGAERGT
ncbi:MAG: tyrosine-type recombinase/integrase [Acidobacteriota bacterium]|nr:tyrosine-type recombinase/integrase [Acidobacteriota bacterium]